MNKQPLTRTQKILAQALGFALGFLLMYLAGAFR